MKKNRLFLLFFGYMFLAYGQTCPNILPNQDDSIILSALSFSGGLDKLEGVGDGRDGSCAVKLTNNDSGEPWSQYRLGIDLTQNNLAPGDEILIGIDGTTAQTGGAARIEVNQNNRPNTQLLIHNFGFEWSRVERTIIVPEGIASLNIWLFSNFNQNVPGSSLYNNLVVRKVADPGSDFLPVADAGLDQTIYLAPGTTEQTVTLDGSASYDPDGNIMRYVWTKGPEFITPSNGGDPIVDVSLGIGVHEFTLSVTDDDDNEVFDSVTVTVLESTQDCPDYIANEDGGIPLPVGSFGSGLDFANGVSDVTNGSECAVQLFNNDIGQPWAKYSIPINLSANGIKAGDKLYFSIDGYSSYGQARIEVVENGRPNTWKIGHSFGQGWSTHEQTIVVPTGISTLNIWLYANYATSDVGYAHYDNLVVRKVSGETDIVPPTAPILDTSTVSSTTANLIWSGATDNVGISNYQIFKDGTLIATTEKVYTFFVTGLSPATSYDFTIKAMDAAGNVSPLSNVKKVYTGHESICPNVLYNENLDIPLFGGGNELGLDQTIGVSDITNGSECAIQLVNNDPNEPWAKYVSIIDLSEHNISAGDELFISVDGNSTAGQARIEVVEDGRPNTWGSAIVLVKVGAPTNRRL